MIDTNSNVNALMGDALAGKEMDAAQRINERKVWNPQELKKAAQEFEKMMYQMVFKSMRDAMPKDELTGGGMGGDVYTSMLDQEYVNQLASNGPQSLAEMIYKQFTEQGMVRAEPTESCHESASLPFKGRVTSEFGKRCDPFTNEERNHCGLDIAGEEGAPIQAALSGKVSFSGEMPGYGNVVVLDHANGIQTMYAHNRQNLVREGELVSKGQLVAELGSTGRSTGPHVHFEVKKDGEAVNPRTFFGTKVAVNR